MKTTVCMAYINRYEQLIRTLGAFGDSDKDFSVVIANDDKHPLYNSLLPDIGRYVEILDRGGIKEKEWHDPAVPMNKALKTAINELDSDIILLCNPECMPIGDIINDCQNITDNEYRVYGCLSLDKHTSENINDIDLKGLAGSIKEPARRDNDLAWYQHSIFRPVGYEFCAAIKADNMRKLNGYDERLAFGIGYSDNYLLYRIKKMGLKINMVDNPFVVHQWHQKTDDTTQRQGMINYNRLIYEQLITTDTTKAKHLLTQDIL